MIQSDHPERVVSLENLKAMCDRLSRIDGNIFWIDRTTRNRVYVSVTIPDDAGYSCGRTVTASFPCYPSPWDGQNNPYVVLDPVRIIGVEPDDYDPSQYFWPLFECPRLFRDANGAWHPEEALRSATA
jgi:hypothetical protein